MNKVKNQHAKAVGIIKDARQKPDALAEYLYETITGEEFMSIFNS